MYFLLLLTSFIRAIGGDRRWSFRRHFNKIQRRDEAIIIEGRYFGTSSVKRIFLKARDKTLKLNENSKPIDLVCPSDKKMRSSPEFNEEFLTFVYQRRLLIAAEHLQQRTRRGWARVNGDVVAGAVAATRIEVLPYKMTMHPGRFKDFRTSFVFRIGINAGISERWMGKMERIGRMV